ncbi:DUF2141 domain-containing protein [Asticcacaulis sp. DXS10W]|uniref:DUF2141 domain-containing protein n=1 Tax=Asticcacaulis currens TaxID=2984210 RepID=A0ABT5IDU9_9CAUL|nr:DUF2141 domain-containing protein [Asticcacaulis currens]MDC7694380.1 DUF2141 domain-containing protein [Asticcacaulis currens]
MRLFSKFAAAILCSGCCLSAATTAAADDLIVSVKNVRSSKGQISAQLLKANPDRGVAEAFSGAKVAAVAPETELHFKDLPPGDYCIMLFHDENENGTMDKNLLGIPSEGYGFSNNARGSFGPPKFSQMKFTVVAGKVANTSVTIAY